MEWRATAVAIPNLQVNTPPPHPSLKEKKAILRLHF